MLKGCYCHSLVNCCLAVIAAAVADVVAVGSMKSVDHQVVNAFDVEEANVIAAMAVVNGFGAVLVAVDSVDPLESAATSTVAESWLEEPLWHYLAGGFSAHCLTAVETTFSNCNENDKSIVIGQLCLKLA